MYAEIRTVQPFGSPPTKKVFIIKGKKPEKSIWTEPVVTTMSIDDAAETLRSLQELLIRHTKEE